MASSNTQLLLFVIVGKNEPLYEAEFHKTGTAGSSDSVTRQNYFVLHSSLDLVEKAAWTTNAMYLKVVDKVRRKLCEAVWNPEGWIFQNSCVLFDLTGEPTASVHLFDCRAYQIHVTARRQVRRHYQEFLQRSL
jgi:Sedlin, N-terminal conserved region